MQGLLAHWGALIRIGWVPNCCQWPSRSILWFVYIPVVCWEHSTTVCALMAVFARLRLATHPHHPTPPPSHPPTPYKRNPWYYRACKKTIKNQQWILHGRVSYEIVAIRLLYLYGKSCVAIMQHRRATAASMFQNSISRNTKCDIMVGFPNPVTITITITQRLVVISNYIKPGYIHMKQKIVYLLILKLLIK